MEKFEQIIKCRDDHEPLTLLRLEGEPGAPKFQLSGETACSWHKKEDDSFGPEKLRSRVEPWLTALFQSDHFSLLAGSGLTHAVHLLAAKASPTGMAKADFSEFSTEIATEVKRVAEAAGRKDGNIEDQIRVANELLRGLEIQAAKDSELKPKAESLKTDLTKILASFAQSILLTENKIATAKEEHRNDAFNYLVSFLMSFASRAGTRDRLQIFTTNYDRLFEAGAEVAGLHLLDRFVGSLAPIFRSSRLDVDMHYNPPGIRGEPRYLEGIAKITKLHGSVDWVDAKTAIRRVGVPFGAKSIEPFFEAPGLSGAKALQLMIYPNAAKDRETSLYPYVELFRDFAAAVCRPNSTVVTYGYSFGDEHINRVIEDMLTIPSTHLVIISFDDPLGRIMDFYEKLGRHAQVSLLIGDHLGNLKELVDNYLPKPAIDRTTFRVAELLKSRWGSEKHDLVKGKKEDPEGEKSS